MEIIQALNQVSRLSAEAMGKLEAIVFERTYPKGHHLLSLWQVDHHFHYIVKGSGRVYYMRNGQDITDYLALDHQFIGGVESIFTKQPSHKAIELFEESVVQSFCYEDFELLCEQYHEIERLGRKLAVFAFLSCQKRIEDIRFLSASERYEELHRKFPGISNRVPLKHLASYLGTTPVSLSRIRSGNQ